MTSSFPYRAWRLGLAALWLLPLGCDGSAPNPQSNMSATIPKAPPPKRTEAAEPPKPTETAEPPKPTETVEVSVPPRPALDTIRPAVPRSVTGSGRDGSPATVAWSVRPDPLPASESFRLPAGTSFPMPAFTRVLYPSTPSPFIAIGANYGDRVGREVWDLRALRRVGGLNGKVGESATSFQLSPDGKYIAVRLAVGGRSSSVEIYSVAKGRRVQTLEPKPRPDDVLAFDFAAPGQFLVVASLQPSGKSLHFFDIATGIPVQSQSVPESLQEGSLAFSPTRKYFAYATDKAVTVHETASGRAVGVLPAPGPVAYALAFSPNGKELAGLFPSGRAGRLVVWDLTNGSITIDHRIPGAPSFRVADVAYVNGSKIDWLPDGNAWLIDGHALVDRETGQWLWSFTGPTGTGVVKSNSLDLGLRLVDNDHALAIVQNKDVRLRLEVITLPWAAIDASLKALKSGAPALLKPGAMVSVKCRVGDVRGSTAKAVEAEIVRAVSEGLAGQGLKVADGQPVVLHVRHTEEAGSPYRASSGEKKTFTSTKFSCEVVLTVGDSERSIWTDRWTTNGVGYLMTNPGEQLSDDVLRQRGFDSYLRDLEELVLPSFIPAPGDSELSMLPGETYVGGSPSERSPVTPQAPNRPNVPVPSGPAQTPPNASAKPAPSSKN